MRSIAIAAAIMICFCAIAVAQEPDSGAAPEMPPMGTPDEMKQVEFLIGNWDVTGHMKTDPEQAEWTLFEARASYNMMMMGSILRLAYDGGEMMGTHFLGMSFTTYDREMGQWQMSWFDNMACRTVLYTGIRGEGESVFTAEDRWNGVRFLSRIKTWDETENSFQWKMEHSMDSGQTWWTAMEAVYSKR